MESANRKAGISVGHMLCVGTLFLFFGGIVAIAQDKTNLRKQQTQAWSSFYKGKLVEARNTLLPLMQSKHQDVRVEAVHCYARVYFAEGSQRGKTEALKLWKGIENKSTTFAHQTRMQIAKSLQLAEGGKLKEAERILDPLLAKEYQTTATSEAALVYAEVLIKLGNFKRAAMAAGFAEGFVKSKAGRELGETIIPFVDAAKAMQKRVKLTSRPEKTPKPKDKAAEIFKKAQAHRAKKQYPQSLMLYHQIMDHYSDSPYAPRSELHTGHCYLGAGQVDKAIAIWEIFVNKAPCGPWRGQACMELIDTALAYKFAPEKADLRAEQARTGLESSDQDKSWQEVLGELHLRFGILALSNNKGKEAISHLNIAKSHIKKPSKQAAASLNRLLHAAEDQGSATPGDLIGNATSEKREKIQARSVRLLSIGTMLCLLDKNRAALKLLTNLVHKASGFTSSQKSYAFFILGLSRRRIPNRSGKHHADALLSLNKSLSLYPSGSWHDETLYHASHVIYAEARRLYSVPDRPAPWDVPYAERIKETKESLSQEELERKKSFDNLHKASALSLSYWKRLVAKFPQSPRVAEAYFNIGKIYLEQNQTARSFEAFAKVTSQPMSQWLAGEALFLLCFHYLDHKIERQKCYNTFLEFEKWYKEVRTGKEIEIGVQIDPKTGRYPPLWVLNGAEIKFVEKKPVEGVLALNPNLKYPSRMRAMDLSSEEIRACFNKKDYLESRGSMSSAIRGFILLINHKNKDAAELFTEMGTRDPFVIREHPNSSYRMRKVCKFGGFGSEPMDLFKTEKHIMAIYLSCFYYCIEKFEKSKEVAQRLLAGEFGPVTSRQKEYGHYRIAKAIWWIKGKRAAYYEFIKAFGSNLENLKKKDCSLIQDLCANAAGVTICSVPTSSEYRLKGVLLHKTLVDTGRRNEYCASAYRNYARWLIEHGYPEEGMEMLRKMAVDHNYGEKESHLAKWYYNHYQKYIKEGCYKARGEGYKDPGLGDNKENLAKACLLKNVNK